jgi:hypothetical protein
MGGQMEEERRYVWRRRVVLAQWVSLVAWLNLRGLKQPGWVENSQKACWGTKKKEIDQAFIGSRVTTRFIYSMKRSQNEADNPRKEGTWSDVIGP